MKEFYEKNKKYILIGAGILSFVTAGKIIYDAGFYDGCFFSSSCLSNLFKNNKDISAEELVKHIQDEFSTGKLVYDYTSESFKPFMMYRR